MYYITLAQPAVQFFLETVFDEDAFDVQYGFDKSSLKAAPSLNGKNELIYKHKHMDLYI